MTYSGGCFLEIIQPLSGKSVFQGYSVISTFDTSIARIVFFDTYEAIGVATEIMGITKEGEMAVEEMKRKMK